MPSRSIMLVSLCCATLLPLAALAQTAGQSPSTATGQTSAAANAPTSSVIVRGSSRAPVQSITRAQGRSAPTLFPNSSLPVRLNAPVLAPYDNSSYRDLGGQPETGADATMAQDSINH